MTRPGAATAVPGTAASAGDEFLRSGLLEEVPETPTRGQPPGRTEGYETIASRDQAAAMEAMQGEDLALLQTVRGSGHRLVDQRPAAGR